MRGDGVKCDIVWYDEGLWRVGGAAVRLGFVQPRPLGGIGGSSEDMEMFPVMQSWRIHYTKKLALCRLAP
ncbi:unnamed protein product [Rhizoctonia solani]|uniref:Uncharacterized protein n=1 Tax=Rhizoctonia solani TaxID=456999 RepID=A0A8H3GI80_9AGAM|nr:unnamed protein product [Rhizoctonia solani]